MATASIATDATAFEQAHGTDDEKQRDSAGNEKVVVADDEPPAAGSANDGERQRAADAGDDATAIGVGVGDGAGADANVVWWDGPTDPANPYNWPVWRVTLNCGLISALTLVTPLASSMLAPGVPEIMREFRSNSPYLASFVVSVYVLGFAAGPLLFAPLSEIYGRTVIYHLCNLGFVGMSIACAKAPSLSSLVAFRFFAGLFGSCPITNGGGSITDMVRQERRGAAMSIFTIGPLLGPIIGPVAGGFLAEAKGWRWVFWVLSILGGAIGVAMLLFLRETYAPVLLARKAAKLRKETGNQALRSKLDTDETPRDYFRRGIVRPLKLLAFSPITQIFGIYIAVVYGYLYLMFTSITEIFMQYYGFTTSTVGLVFLGIGIGSLLGLVYFAGASDRNIKRASAKADEEAAAAGREREGMKPEYRLPPLRWGGILLPAGLFIYGWTAEYHVHWIAPIMGTVLVGVGNLVIFMALSMYLIDAFHVYAASALAANAVVRSVAGAVLPLAGLRMYQVLGVGWGNSLLGFIASVLIPVPFLIIRYGEYLRKRFEIKNL